MLIYTVQLNQHCTVCTEVCIERPLFLFLRISQNCLLNDLSEQLLGLSPTFLFNYITFVLSLRQTQCLSFLTRCLSGAYFLRLIILHQDRMFIFLGFLAFDFGHSFFSSPPQRPMTSDFEGFSIPDCIHYI